MLVFKKNQQNTALTSTTDYTVPCSSRVSLLATTGIYEANLSASESFCDSGEDNRQMELVRAIHSPEGMETDNCNAFSIISTLICKRSIDSVLAPALPISNEFKIVSMI